MTWDCHYCKKSVDDKECKHEAKSKYNADTNMVHTTIYRWCPYCETPGPVSVYSFEAGK